MYKDSLKEISKYPTVDAIIEEYEISGDLYSIVDATEQYYELVFDRQRASPVYIPRITDEDLLSYPKFYLSDDNIMLDARETLILCLLDRFELWKNNSNVFKMKHFRHLKNDIISITRYFINIQPFSINNRIKNECRIRVVKTCTIKDEIKDYSISTPFGKSLWEQFTPNSKEEIQLYSKMFNDPIKCEALCSGIYVQLHDDLTYKGVGLTIDEEKIVSIYPSKSNLPERLRQHYTSNYLEPKYPDKDNLRDREDQKMEKVNAFTVFAPITTDVDHPFNDPEGPLGKYTLAAGEVLISENFMNREYWIRRTVMTSSIKGTVIKKGTKINHGDVLFYDQEGLPEQVYELNYSDAVIEDVIKTYNSYKIVIRASTPLNVGRIISDYGIKGVSHPRKNLGTITMPQDILDKYPDIDAEYTVDLISGPISFKSGSNGVRLSWLNMMNWFDDKFIDLNKDNISEEEINQLTSNIKKVKWTYHGKDYWVYVGMVSFGVTSLAKDFKINKVRVMPEALKYMYASDSEHFIKVADLLLQKHVDIKDKWLLNELLYLNNNKINDEDKVFDWDDKHLQNFGLNTFLNINNWFNNDNKNSLLLNPMNNGFVIRFNDHVIKMPSAKLLTYLCDYNSGTFSYPEMLRNAMLVLLSLKNLYNKNGSEKNINDNIKFYKSSICELIYAKKKAFPMACSPIINGGHLKQMVSSFVPRGVTVVLDKHLIKQIYKFRDGYNKPIYEIGVRNPVLWRFMVWPKKVWTFDDFKKYLKKRRIDIDDIFLSYIGSGAVLRNTIDTLHDRSDTDGDLYPVAIAFDKEIQDNLNLFMENNYEMKDYETEWIVNYIKDEVSKNIEFADIENKPFKYFVVEKSWFAEKLADAANAKATVGLATTDLWRFHSECELAYLDELISKEERDYLEFLYSKIVQDFVISGIKHVEGGASGYDLFSLDGIIAHKEVVFGSLVNIGVPEDIANKFILIAEMCKEGKINKLAFRLATGGNPESTSKLTKHIDLLDDNKRESPYIKIWRNYIQAIS